MNPSSAVPAMLSEQALSMSGADRTMGHCIEFGDEVFLILRPC